MRKFISLSCMMGFAVLATGEQLEPLSPQDSLAKIVVNAELRVELVAAEPEVFDPVALCFDAAGRMYVVEDRGYPTGPGEGMPPAGSIALLEDRDGDGMYETRTEFASGLSFPNGVMPWKDGVLVTDAPNVYFLRDSDGDGRADLRETVLTGFAEGGSTQLRVSHPTLGIDNWIYFTNGLSGGKVSIPGHPDAGVVEMGGSDLRWNPHTNTLETTAGQAQFGLTFDDFGNKFVCSNRNHIQMVMLQPKDLARNPKYTFSQTVDDIPEHGEAARLFPLSENKTTAYSHTGTFTAACGLHIYRGNALPQAYYGNAFVCDPTGNLVHRDILVPHGPGLIARRGEQEREFFASRDEWSRPVFVTTGPDGALYVCDMYRKSIEHPTYLPPEIASITDFEAGKDKGRIYRITSKDAVVSRQAIQAIRMDNVPAKTLAARLDDPNGWVRDTARRLLLEQNTSNNVRLLKNAMRRGESGHGRVAAMYLLETYGQLDDVTINTGLRDKHPQVRAHAARLARRNASSDARKLTALLELARDADPRTRFEAAIALGDVEDKRKVRALAEILVADIDNAWTQAAVLSGAGADVAMVATLVLEKTTPPRDLARSLGTLVVGVEDSKSTIPSLGAILRDASVSIDSWQLAFLLGICEGGQQNEILRKAENVYDGLGNLCGNVENARDKLQFIASNAFDIAQHEEATETQRCMAIELLAHMGYSRAGEALTAIVTSDAPDDVRVAAVNALARMADPKIADSLTHANAWPAFTPKVRATAIAALVLQPQRIPSLLTAIEQGIVEPWALDASQRASLIKSADADIRRRAAAVFEKYASADRSHVYNETKKVLSLEANPDAGKVVFENVCAKCHVYQGNGKNAGPDLSDVRAQPIETILKHIVDPNAEVTKGFESYTVETVDGESYSGIIGAESPSSITVRQALGVENMIDRSQISKIEGSRLSLMPEGLEQAMKPQELRDLIGFLKR
jgi:putative membrane-bound dehydrogenase-like protein